MRRYIRAMSLDRGRAKKRLDAYASIIEEHIIKLLVYSDIRPNDIQGWIHTVANWIHQGDSITVKPSAKKLSVADLESSLFNFMGTETRDYMSALYAFEANNLSGKLNSGNKESYPTFDISMDLAADLMELCEDVKEVTMPLLCDKQDHSLNEYEAALQPIFRSLA